jgi:hypothetical protein
VWDRRSESGTFETCRPALNMSGHRGRPEVTGRNSKRRFLPQADIPVSSSGMFAFADDSCIRAKNDVPKNRRHAVITILEAMMREVPHLC